MSDKYEDTRDQMGEVKSPGDPVHEWYENELLLPERIVKEWEKGERNVEYWYDMAFVNACHYRNLLKQKRGRSKAYALVFLFALGLGVTTTKILIHITT